MRVHHTTVHDEQLPNQHCSDCDTAFYAPYTDRVRCEDCNRPHQTGPRDTTRGDTTGICLTCDSTFTYYSSEKEGHYCPECVADDNIDCTVHVQTTAQVSVSCANCDEPQSVFPSEAIEQTNHFCDRACYREWLSTTQQAEGKWSKADNPNWNGGIALDEPYGEGWPQARQRTLERDDHTCQRCGDTNNELGQNPDVHHIHPVRTFDDPRNAHTLDNLICLCRTCHLAVEQTDATLKHNCNREKPYIKTNN
ncbi:HNH endonuclease [Halorussus halophilus]|uniref:HNH endonuclease n=1 Tax=Halorussus halophilus TaxID=2650975 RepID=UPI001CE44294